MSIPKDAAYISISNSAEMILLSGLLHDTKST